MTEILVQPEIHKGALAGILPGPRIPVMPKRGPYLRAQPRPPKPVITKVRAWRQFCGMTLETLAEESGLSVSSISAYERGGNDPSLEAAGLLAEAMGITRGMLLDIDPREDPTLWAAFLRANPAQRRDLARMADALVGPPPKRK